MYQIQIPWNKVFKGLKYLLILLILLGIGYVGYLTYYYATNSPYEVRVTNLTGSSATVSWYTNRPDGGVVYLKDKNSFTPVFSKLGSTVAYDDRDVAKAQEEWVNKQVSKATNNVDADYEISLDEKALSELPVKKKGKYYVHHVTINNLQEEKQYYFRVGNGVFMWNINENNQKYAEYEAPTVKEFGFKTYKDRDLITTPSPSFGSVLSLSRNEDGFLIENPNTDSIVFLNALNVAKNEMSLYQSSVTNNLGGWVIDKSNIVDANGDFSKGYQVGKDKIYIYAQLENLSVSDFKELTWGVDDAPAKNLRINNELTTSFGSFFQNVTQQIFTQNNGNILSGLIYKSYAIDCPDDYKPLHFGCVRESTPTPPNPTPTPTPTTPSSPQGGSSNSGNIPDEDENDNSKDDNGCPAGKIRVHFGCIDDPSDGGCPEGKKPFRFGCVDENTPVASPTTVVNTPSTPNSNPNTPSSDNDCPNNQQPIQVNGVTVCGNATANRAQNYTDSEGNKPSCTGRHVASCNAGDSCYCQWDDSLGYSALPGESCRPESCASIANGDVYYSGGTEVIRKKADGTLCGTDTTSPGCYMPKDRTAQGDVNVPSVTICGTGRTLNAEGKCEGTQVANPTGGTSGGNNGNSGNGNQNSDDNECRGVGKVSTPSGGCACAAGYIALDVGYWGTVCSPSQSNSSTPAISSDNRANGKCVNDNGAVLNCGVYENESCNDNRSIRNNDGCSNGDYCVYTDSKAGVCVPKGVNVGVPTFAPGEYNFDTIEDLDHNYLFDCYVKIGKTGNLLDVQIVRNRSNDYLEQSTNKEEGTWESANLSVCVDRAETSMDLNQGIENRVYAESNVKVDNEGPAIMIFPESGVYDVQIGKEKFKNVYVDKSNRHFFYKEVNGKPGYQLPKDEKKLSKKDDQLLPAVGAVVTLYEKSSNQNIKISKGINIVSFNFVPSRLEGKNMNAKQLMRILNSSGTKVTRITTFEGGKWLGGLAYNENKGEIVGNDFLVLPGKGYLIVSNTDYTATVPGYGIKNSIPVALSDGWNLIGVNGYSKTYTAASMIKTVNEIEGVGANNVTWWPTSKGRYESFQKSEGTEYGFDFPLLKDVGYFVRINKFDRDGAKSVIWNPGGDLHGENGSK